MAVYLIHIDKGIQQKPNSWSCHYIGFSNRGLESRLAYHRSGRGSRWIKACTEAGLVWTVVRLWPNGDRTFERKLKNRKEAHVFPDLQRRSA